MIEGITVYNFTVSDGATYFVDDGEGDVSAVLVHNLPACKLAANLIDDGFRRSLNKAGKFLDIPHHIVARGLFTRWTKSGAHQAAKKSQEILVKHGIDLNDAANGVFLSKLIHKVDSAGYIKEVSRRLTDADAIGKSEVIDALRKIGDDLVSGALKL